MPCVSEKTEDLVRSGLPCNPGRRRIMTICGEPKRRHTRSLCRSGEGGSVCWQPSPPGLPPSIFSHGVAISGLHGLSWPLLLLLSVCGCGPPALTGSSPCWRWSGSSSSASTLSPGAGRSGPHGRCLPLRLPAASAGSCARGAVSGAEPANEFTIRRIIFWPIVGDIIGQYWGVYRREQVFSLKAMTSQGSASRTGIPFASGNGTDI